MIPLLQVDTLCKGYGEKHILQDISLVLQEGEILCLLGPSGSGKTSLLRLLAGLEVPDAGRVLFAGENMRDTLPHKRHFGMMFQDYALFPHKNVAENICFGMEMRKWPAVKQQQRLHAMLELIGLSAMSARKMEELSGGERQRVALARSLAVHPRLLLLDEPLGSLDRVLRDRLAGEIRMILKNQNLTAVFVTHDQSEAFAVADKVAILRQGRLEQFGSPESVYRQPKTRQVASFLGFQNIIDSRSTLLSELFNPVPQQLQPFSGQLLLRPEGASLSGQHIQGDSWPKLHGVLTNRQFQGQHYTVAITTGTFTFRFNLSIDPAPPQVGEDVTLDINPKAMVKLPGEDI